MAKNLKALGVRGRKVTKNRVFPYPDAVRQLDSGEAWNMNEAPQEHLAGTNPGTGKIQVPTSDSHTAAGTRHHELFHVKHSPDVIPKLPYMKGLEDCRIQGIEIARGGDPKLISPQMMRTATQRIVGRQNVNYQANHVGSIVELAACANAEDFEIIHETTREWGETQQSTMDRAYGVGWESTMKSDAIEMIKEAIAFYKTDGEGNSDFRRLVGRVQEVLKPLQDCRCGERGCTPGKPHVSFQKVVAASALIKQEVKHSGPHPVPSHLVCSGPDVHGLGKGEGGEGQNRVRTNRSPKVASPDHEKSDEELTELAKRSGHGASKGQRREDLKPADIESDWYQNASDAWGSMTVQKVALTRLARRKGRGAFNISADYGSIPRRWSNWGMNKKVFVQRVKEVKGGTILYDLSGSMGISGTMIQAMVEALPAATQAGYEGANESGDLRVFVKGGRGVAPEFVGHPNGSGGNTVDGPALRWLARQPGPRFWISDGGVHGANSRQSSGSSAQLANDCDNIMRFGKILRFYNASHFMSWFKTGSPPPLYDTKGSSYRSQQSMEAIQANGEVFSNKMFRR